MNTATSQAFASALSALGSNVEAPAALLCQRLTAPTTRDAAVRAYAQGLWLNAELFPGVLARMIDKAPDDQARWQLMENLLDEAGLGLCSTEGLSAGAMPRHSKMAEALLAACGAEIPQVRDPRTVPIFRPAIDFLDKDAWLEAVSYLLVGVEANVPAHFRAVRDVLAEIGYSDQQMVFLDEHIRADELHGDEGVAMVVRVAETPDQRKRALRAARMGARYFTAMHH